MGRIFIGALVAGVIVFMWGAFVHMGTSLGHAGMRDTDDAALGAALERVLSERAVYGYPLPANFESLSPEEQEAAWAGMKGKPGALIFWNPEGWPNGPTPKMLVAELASNVVGALVAAIVLSYVAASYLTRALLVAAMAAFGWISILASYWIWYRFPTDFTLAAGVVEVGGWLIAGLALAKIVPACCARPAAG